MGFVVTAFVFASPSFEGEVERALQRVGLSPREDELKSSARMDSDHRMRAARDAALDLAGSSTRIAVFFGPYDRSSIGKDCLQALQSVLLRNGLSGVPLDVHFDEDIFPSAAEAERLQALFCTLRDVEIHPREDSRLVLGIQVADVVAHCFGQILKEEMSGESKEVEIGGSNTGYPDGTKAPLGWKLLMSLRYSLLTRPIAYQGQEYAPESDPIVLDPVHDDPVNYGQHPTLLGWGVQVAPEASA
ncbi:MAG: hypothetical protein FJX72_10500, partial [Armatimonadetes bacterium]|nr:hypothetical protein [Armatimonadota bacterium]